MRMALFGVVAAAIAFASSPTQVEASYHTEKARELTLIRLNKEVTQVCPAYYMFGKCAELRSLLSELYRNKKVASEKDLVILRRMEELGQNTFVAQLDLADAIDSAQALFRHVVYDHQGVWADHLCSSPPEPS